MGYCQLISKPVSEDTPCGNELSNDAGFQNFFFMAEGKPETYDGKNTLPAEAPEWATIKKQALSYLGGTKDLKLICVLSQAVLNTEGLVQFEQCLKGISDLISEFWQETYPPLDEDDGEPQERLSAIGHLSDQHFVLDILKSYPLAKSNLLGSVTLRDLENTSETTPIIAVFKDSDQDNLALINESAVRCLRHLNAINKIFVENAGKEYIVNFDSLTKVLTQITNAFVKYSDVQLARPTASAESVAAAESEKSNQSNVAETLSNAANLSFPNNNVKLTTRSDVEKCLELICQYFEEHEPSSPVPLLLNRAKSLINLDFIGVIKEMAPESLEQLNKLGGLSE